MTTFTLRLIALFTMLLDHIGFVFFPECLWLRCIGRLAFPLYAFLLCEGVRHSHSRARYAVRLLALAVLSEIPYDLLTQRSLLCFARQNVVWTLLLGLVVLVLIDQIQSQRTLSPIVRGVEIFYLVFLASATAELAALDYGCFGILLILLFRLTRSLGWAIQTGCIFLLSICMSEPTFCLLRLHVPIQTFATLAIVPIACHSGKQGLHSPLWTWIFYLFFPVHLVLLFLLRQALH